MRSVRFAIIFSVLVGLACVGAMAQEKNYVEGYENLPWGSTLQDVRKVYPEIRIKYEIDWSQMKELSDINKFHADVTDDMKGEYGVTYSCSVDDDSDAHLFTLFFSFYDDRLYQIEEKHLAMFDDMKNVLVAKYGRPNKNGIYINNTRYCLWDLSKISIVVQDQTLNTTVFYAAKSILKEIENSGK